MKIKSYIKKNLEIFIHNILYIYSLNYFHSNISQEVFFIYKQKFAH